MVLTYTTRAPDKTGTTVKTESIETNSSQPQGRTLLRMWACWQSIAQGPPTAFFKKAFITLWTLSLLTLPFAKWYFNKSLKNCLCTMNSSFACIRNCAAGWVTELSLCSAFHVSSLSKERDCRLWWDTGAVVNKYKSHCEKNYWPGNMTGRQCLIYMWFSSS